MTHLDNTGTLDKGSPGVLSLNQICLIFADAVDSPEPITLLCSLLAMYLVYFIFHADGISRCDLPPSSTAPISVLSILTSNKTSL